MQDVLFVGTVKIGKEEDHYHLLALFKVGTVPRAGDTLELPGFLSDEVEVSVTKVVWLLNPMNSTAYVPRVIFEVTEQARGNMGGWGIWSDDRDENELNEINERITEIVEHNAMS